MSDTIAEPITLEAFDPAELLMDANARSDAEATVDKAFVASLKAHAATSPKFPVYGDRTRLAECGNYVPITIVRRTDGQLRVRARAAVVSVPARLAERAPAERHPRPADRHLARGRARAGRLPRRPRRRRAVGRSRLPGRPGPGPRTRLEGSRLAGQGGPR